MSLRVIFSSLKLLLVAVGVTAVAATLPKPAISSGIDKNSKEIRGTISKPSGTIEIEIDGVRTIPVRQLIEFKRLEFLLELEGELQPNNKVRIRHVDGGDSSDWTESTVDPKKSPSVSLVSAEANFGASRVRVFFAPLSSSVEKARLNVKTCLEEKSYSLTADDFKKTSIEIALDRGLYCAEAVKLSLSATAKNADESATATMESLVAKPVISIAEPAKEGEANVAGTASGAISKVRIQVFSGWQYTANSTVTARAKQQLYQSSTTQQADGKDSVDEDAKVCDNDPVQSVEGPVEAGKFSIPLLSRLNAGDCIVARPIFTNLPDEAISTAANISSKPVRAASVLLDWGRVRGYFSVGGAVSQYRQQFSQVDTFIGFTGDTRVFGRLVDKNSDRGQELPLHAFRYQLNLFTEARVSVRLASTGTSISANTTAEAAAAGSRTGASSPDNLSLGSDQPGYFQVGLHLPLSFKGMDWYHKGGAYSFYFSPIVKFGGQTSDQPVNIARNVVVDSSKPVTDSARYTITRDETRGGVLPFYGYGARFGLFRYDLLGKRLSNRQVANDPIGYIDFTWGQAKALRTYSYFYQYGTETKGPFLAPQNFLDTTTGAKLTGIQVTSELRPRFNIEGRLKIPYLPALIGVDLDVRTPSRDSEPNQLRFVVAFRIDAQKALGRVFANDGLKSF